MNKLLIGVLVFLVLMAVIGALKGLARMVLSVAAVVLAVVLVCVAAPYARNVITEKTDMEEKLCESVTNKLSDLIGSDNALTERVDNLPLTDGVKEVLENTETAYDRKMTELGSSVANLIFSAAIYLILFVIFFIVLRFLAYIIEKMADTDGLRFWNRAGGAVLALLEGVLILDVAALALVFFTGTPWGLKAYELIYSDGILTWMYDNNLLLLMINRHAA